MHELRLLLWIDEPKDCFARAIGHGAVFGDEAHRQVVQQVHSFVRPGDQAAFAEFMADPNEYLSLPAFYQQKRDVFQQAMAHTRFKALPSYGTYFQLYDYSAISDEPDLDFCKRLTTAHGVAAIPVSSFFTDQKDERVIRFCFAKTEDLLMQAAEQLAGV